MSTIGLDRLVYAKITEDESGSETYGIPIQAVRPSVARQARA